MKSAGYWIEKLDLFPHPEGGFFREIYRSEDTVSREHLPERYTGDRNFSTSIYFLLKSENFSAFHKLNSDETWHFYYGSAVKMYIINDSGNLSEVIFGSDPGKNEVLQFTVKAGNWFAAEVVEDASYSLIGCTVSPGFHFEDFELAERKKLIERFPQHVEIITRLTRV